MRPSRHNELKRLRPQLALTYAALLGGVIAPHPYLRDRWVYWDAHPDDPPGEAPNYPAHLTHPSRADAAIWFLASHGYILTDDCRLIK